MKKRRVLKSALPIVMALAGASVASAVGFIVLHGGDISSATAEAPVSTASSTSAAASGANTASKNSLVHAPAETQNAQDQSVTASNKSAQNASTSDTGRESRFISLSRQAVP